MPSFDSGRAANLGGLNVRGLRTNDMNGIRFDANRSALPTSANDFILFRHGGSLKVWDGSY